jgi:uncharacterized phage protein gp47/JayE
MAIGLQILPTGPLVPSYADILAFYQNTYQSIFGSDVSLDPSTQDGQWIAAQAQAYYDVVQFALAVYNSFPPGTAQGAALSSMVKINGLQRKVATNSQAVVTIVGQVGTIITNGLVGDNLNLGTRWALPASVTIPSGGSITVTATCTEVGDTGAAAGSLTTILTPTLGWQSVTNAAIAVLGQPVEDDATLRQRQAASTSINAEAVIDGIFAAIDNLAGVERLAIYENSSNFTDSNGVVAHTIACVVEGGQQADIANAIASKKPPGTGTQGTTSVVVTDPKGVTNTINFYPLTLVTINVAITIKALSGYLTTTAAVIEGAIAAFLTGLAIGEKSYLNRLYAPANLSGDAATLSSGFSQAVLDGLASTYNVVSITQSRSGPPVAADVALAFNEAAFCVVANVAFTQT